MIHNVVQVSRMCSVALCADGDTALPESDVLIKGMARALLPDGDWFLDRIEWDSERAVIVYYIEEDQ